jgi:hypothetical protein
MVKSLWVSRLFYYQRKLYFESSTFPSSADKVQVHKCLAKYFPWTKTWSTERASKNPAYLPIAPSKSTSSAGLSLPPLFLTTRCAILEMPNFFYIGSRTALNLGRCCIFCFGFWCQAIPMCLISLVEKIVSKSTSNSTLSYWLRMS